MNGTYEKEVQKALARDIGSATNSKAKGEIVIDDETLAELDALMAEDD